MCDHDHMTELAPSPLDPRSRAVVDLLHTRSDDQLSTMSTLDTTLRTQVLDSLLGGAEAVETTEAKEWLADKLVALDADKGRLAYTFCRALDARQAVEVGTSFGVSTIYLAAALRDNAAAGGGERRVIGTEIEPAKAKAALANLAEAGLAGFAEVREGDALHTLQRIDGPVDFLLIDTWIPLALPALKLLKPKLRPGAIVMCDNVRQFARAYRDYTDFVRNPANGFRSMLWPRQGGVELSVYSDPAT